MRIHSRLAETISSADYNLLKQWVTYIKNRVGSDVHLSREEVADMVVAAMWDDHKNPKYRDLFARLVKTGDTSMMSNIMSIV